MREISKALHTENHTKELWIENFDRFCANTALEVHDIQLIDIDKDRLILEMPMGDHARQPYGLLHGGISMMLAESAASLHACWGVNLGKRVPVGIEINGSHLRPAEDGNLEIRCTVIRRSKTLIHHHIDIVHRETGKLLSTSRVTNMYRSTVRN